MTRPLLLFLTEAVYVDYTPSLLKVVSDIVEDSSILLAALCSATVCHDRSATVHCAHLWGKETTQRYDAGSSCCFVRCWGCLFLLLLLLYWSFLCYGACLHVRSACKGAWILVIVGICNPMKALTMVFQYHAHYSVLMSFVWMQALCFALACNMTLFLSLAICFIVGGPPLLRG